MTLWSAGDSALYRHVRLVLGVQCSHISLPDVSTDRMIGTDQLLVLKRTKLPPLSDSVDDQIDIDRHDQGGNMISKMKY